MRSWRFGALLCAMAWMGWIGGMSAQAPGAPVASGAPAQAAAAKPARMSCIVNKEQPSEAEKALSREEYASALDLYGKMAATNPNGSKAGVIRTLIEQNKVKEAEDQAKAWAAEQPQNFNAAETMAEVLYRKGEIRDAFLAEVELVKEDPCLPRMYLTTSRIQRLIGNYATAKRQIDLAQACSGRSGDQGGLDRNASAGAAAGGRRGAAEGPDRVE